MSFGEVDTLNMLFDKLQNLLVRKSTRMNSRNT